MCGAQPLGNAVAQQPVHQFGAARPDRLRLRRAPAPVALEEVARLGRQVIEYGNALARAKRPRMGRQMPVVLVQRHHGVGGTKPQRLAHQGEGRRVERAIVLNVTVAMQDHTVPGAKVRRDAR